MNIADTIRAAHTQGPHRPFHKAAMTKKPVKPTDPDALEICKDPIPAGRAKPGNKYEPIFSAMTMGDAVKCKPEEIGRIAGAMRKWVETREIAAVVRTIRDYGDGKGRVWMLARDGKA